MTQVLVIDDDQSFREVMLYHLAEEKIDAVGAENPKDGLDIFDPALHPVVITDLKMPGIDGMEVLRRIKKQSPSTVVLVITAFGTIEKAVEAMRAGAYDFIPKPCTRDHFKFAVKKALEHYHLSIRVKELEHVLRTGGRELLYVSDSMKKAVALIDKVATTSATVLISGESGTGKELFAQRLHRKSPRIDGPFVAVNCGAIPKDLMESELFGHTKGSFTGATRDRKGKFELAHHGTLFLDEVSEIPIELQTKLLRAISEQTIDVIGKERPVPVNVRIVAASNKDLLAQIEKGYFRQDLYYRLNVFELKIPPLRERPEDIPILTKHFLRQFAPDRPMVIEKDAVNALKQYLWPGNVRELENICRRIALLAEDDAVTLDMLPVLDQKQIQADNAPMDTTCIVLPDEGLPLLDLEKHVIILALKKNRYNQTQTAKYLNIPRHVLLYRIEKYDIRLPGKQ